MSGTPAGGAGVAPHGVVWLMNCPSAITPAAMKIATTPRIL